MSRFSSPSSESTSSLSAEPSHLRQLTPEQKERVAAILDRYMSAMENGAPLSKEAVLEENPDLAELLRTYFESLEELHGIAVGFGASPDQPRGTTEADESEALEAGERRIGDFRLIREIGHGGMGVVFEAFQISLGRPVALKILPFAAVLDSKQTARFKNEAQAAAQLHHPNIVPVYAIGEERGVHYYAMQLIDGQPLDCVIAENRARQAAETDTQVGATTNRHPSAQHRSSARPSTRPSAEIETAIRLGIQAAEALHAAHEYGIVHRDIKPSNLLLDGNGKLWVTDFGLARVQTDAHLTRTGEVVGTRKYMSPEQARGQSTLVDHRSDIYSLGATLYELLTLQPVFADDRLMGRGDAFLDEPIPLRKLRREIPVDLETVILKSLSFDREDRYATAQAFADDLRCVLQGAATTARPPTMADRIARWSRRHGRLVMAAALAGLAAIVALSLGVVLITREKLRAEQNAAAAERNFREAREIIDRFGAQLAERLAGVPGAEDVRAELLRDTLEYYRRFVAQSQDDSRLQLDLAVTYGKVAELTQEFGPSQEAEHAQEAARTLLERLLQQDPANLEYARQLARCHNNLGLIRMRTGKTPEAERDFAAAIRLQDRLCRQFPADEKAAADLALSHSNLGWLLSESGKKSVAETEFQQAIARLKTLTEAHPDDAAHHHRLAAAYHNLASVYLDDGSQTPEEYYRLALRHDRLAATMRPDHAGSEQLAFQASEARTYNDLGSWYARQERLEESAVAYEKAIEIQQRLVARDRAKRSFRHELAVSFNNLGLIQVRRSLWKASETAFHESLRLHEALIEQNPADIDLCSSLGGVYNNLGSVHEEAQRWLEAAQAYEKAIEYQEKSLKSAPGVDRFRAFLAKHYYNYGRVLRRLGRYEDAVDVALKRRELWWEAPEKLVSVAEELALNCQHLPANNPSGLDAKECADLAVETLERAVAGGVRLSANDFDRDTLAHLKDFERFRGWIRSLTDGQNSANP